MEIQILAVENRDDFCDKRSLVNFETHVCHSKLFSDWLNNVIKIL